MSLQLTLTLPLAAHALAHLRTHAVGLERVPAYRTELNVFFGLFPADFEKRGVVVIAREEMVWAVRATALLRLRLHESDLAAIPADTLERAKSEEFPEAQRLPVQAYRLLWSLQLKLLEHYPPASFRLPFGARPILRGIERIQEFYGTRSKETDTPLLYAVAPIPADPNGRSQLMVHNDPVNLATYVVAALQISLGLSEADAKARIREIHERGEAMLWRGDREQAEHYAAALRAWHLRAEVTWAREG